MVDILIFIFAWAFAIAMLLGILGLVIYMIEIIRFSFSKKSFGPLPWWVFWRP